MLWYSAGILTDYDSWGGGSNPTQATGARSGYYLTGYYYGSWAYKLLGGSFSEIWASFYGSFNNSHIGQMELIAPDLSTILAYVQMEGNYVAAYANINGTLTKLGIGTTILTTGTNHQFELHYKRDTSGGKLEVWIDNILEISFTGNTGDPATNLIYAFRIEVIGSYGDMMSEMICTDQGRIGKKRMQVMYLSGTGDLNTADGFMDVLGNTSITSNTSVKTGTYIIPSTIKGDGTLKVISFALSAADTVSVGIFTKNATSLKFTPDPTRQTTGISCLAGAITLNAGYGIPEWSVAAGEYVGIYTATGTLIYNAGTDSDSLSIGSWNYISGNAFSLGTEQTYTTDTSSHAICCYAQYLTSVNLMPTFNGTSAVVTAEKPWQESKRYMAMGSDGQEFLNNCTDLVDTECTAIKALKLTLRGEAGTSITNGQASIKVDDTITYSDTIAMPGVINKRHAYFQGSWTKNQINNLQVGFKAKV